VSNPVCAYMQRYATGVLSAEGATCAARLMPARHALPTNQNVAVAFGPGSPPFKHLSTPLENAAGPALAARATPASACPLAVDLPPAAELGRAVLEPVCAVTAASTESTCSPSYGLPHVAGALSVVPVPECAATAYVYGSLATGPPSQWSARVRSYCTRDASLLALYLGSGQTARLTNDLLCYDLDALMANLRACPPPPLLVDTGAALHYASPANTCTAPGRTPAAGVDSDSDGPPSLQSDSTGDTSPRPNSRRRSSRSQATVFTSPASVRASPAINRRPSHGGGARRASPRRT
jgi:hypothetical protein